MVPGKAAKIGQGGDSPWQKQNIKLLTGVINEGINIKLREKTASGEPFYWSLNSDIGLLPPGSYSIHFNLKCKAGKTVFYDSLRLFMIKIPINFLNPRLRTPAG